MKKNILRNASILFLSVFVTSCSNNQESYNSSITSTNSMQYNNTTSFDGTSQNAITNQSTNDNTSIGNVSDELSSFMAFSFFKSEKADDYIEYQSKNPDFTAEEVVTYVNLGLNHDFYTNIEEIENPDSTLVLSNKYRILPKDYEPADLELIPEKYSKSWRDLYLRKEALDAFIKMCDAAKADGMNIYAASAYRSYDYQVTLYNNYVESDGQEEADTYSSRPGHSEHQTGLVIDIRNEDKDYDDFGSTAEYQWILKNAHKYGFVVHYTEEGEWITGFMKEEWHIRYIGIEHAEKVVENNLVLDAYLIQFN